MFSKSIIDSDAFLDMPQSTQLLYFHLSMRADDDGFVNKPKTIMRIVGASEDDLRILILKKFIIPFESGVVVIKHWKIHNYIQNDRYKETNYKEEKSLLELDENKAYRLLDTECIQNVSTLETQVRIGKDSIGKYNNILSDSSEKISEQVKEIIDYLNQKAGTAYRSNSQKTKDLIKARFNDGFTVEDFKKVIDNKITDWLDNPKMCKYLRPETLFSNKFEGYLNEPKGGAKSATNQSSYSTDYSKYDFSSARDL